MKSRFVNLGVTCLALLLLAMPLHAQKAALSGTGPVQWRASFNTGANTMHINVYPGVDLIFSGSAIRINAQFIVQPGANLDAIRLDLSDLANLKIGPEVSAQLAADKLALRLQVQEIFQAVKGEKQNLAGSFVQHEDGSVGITVPDGYNPKQPLIIILVAIFQPATVQSPAAALSKSNSGATVTSAPPPVSAIITATKTDQVIPDADNNGQAFPGETIKYTVTIQNTGSADATGTTYNDAVDPNTTFTPGSLKMTPLALADNYSTQPNTTISRATSDPDDLLDNDNLGTPAATLASFGGGNLGGTVTGHAAGSTVSPLPSFSDGSLTVGSGGSFSLTPPTGFTGNYTFDYRITNAAGSSDATVSFAVQAGPSAVADNYFTPVNTTLTRTTANTDDLLDNDNLGSPAATLTSFGGGSLGGTVTTNAAGASVALAGGTLTVNSDGSFSLTTPTVTGSFTFQYRLTNVPGTSDATVTIEVRQAPTAVNDSYNTLVNNTLSVAAPGLMVNDTRGFPLANITSFGGGSLGGTVTSNAAGASVALAGGTLQVNSNGSFSLTTPTTTGNFTFDYRITNSSGTSDATVTIEVRKAPTAVADNYTTPVNTTISRTTANTDDLLDNDDRGFPLATIASFGGGSLGGTVTTNAAGASVALAGGTLTVNSDGSFSLTTPTTAGSFNFQYRLSNVAGNSDATVTIEVQGPPLAVDDPNGGLPSNSTPSNDVPVVGTDHPYHTALNTTLTVPDGANDLLANDNLGFPLGTIFSYGTTGNVTAQTSIGSSTPTNQGGSVTVQANGSFSYTPPSATFTGLDQFAYRLQNGSGSSDATVTVAVGVRPAAVADARTATGNVRLSTATNLLDNDTGDQLIVTAFDASSAQGGNVTVAANGSFTYNPPAGYEGSDSFNYTVNNGFATPSVGTVTITVSGMIWFINNTAGAGDGRLTSPFNTLAAFQAVNNGTGNNPAAGDNIFIYTGSGSYTGGVVLLNNQKLIGDGSSSTLAAITGITPATGSDALPTFSGTDPTIENSGGNGITLASGNTIRGLTVGNTPSGFGYSGVAVGTFNIQEASKTGTGGALNISTSGAAGTVQFDNLSSTNAPSQAINLASVTGTISVTSGSISAPTGTAVVVNGGTVTMTYPGSITKNNAGRLIDITSKTSGTLDFSGALSNNAAGATGINVSSNSGGTVTFSNSSKVLNTGANTAVTLSSNSGATINFTNGGLDIDATSGTGFTATGGGTVNVTGSNNTINTTTGTGVNIVTPTNIGGSGVTLRSVSVNGAANGIVLNGTTGSFTVDGDGSNTALGGNSSGGTIANATGSDATTAGIGVYLNNAQNVTLRRMTVNGTNQNFGIYGSSVTNFVMEYCTVSGTNGTSTPSREGSLIFDNMFGTNAVTNSIISGSIEDNVRVENTTGTLTAFNLTNSTIQNNSTVSGNIGFRFATATTGVSMTGTVSNCTFQGNRTDAINVDASNGTMNITVSNNTIIRGTGGNNDGNIGIDVTAANAGQVTYSVTGNKVGTPDGSTDASLLNTGINIFAGGSTCTMTGSVTNNTVINRGAGVSGLGISVFSNGSAAPGSTSITADVSNNTVSNVGLDYGIKAEASGTSFSSSLFVKLTGNNVSVLTGALDAIRVQSRNTSTVCARISGNTTNAGGTGFVGLFVRQANTATFNLEGGTGSLATNNPAAATTGFIGTITSVAANFCGSIP